MFCSSCGESVPEGKAFCKHCGAPVAAAHAAQLARSVGEPSGDTVVRPPSPGEAPTEVKDPGRAATMVRPPDAAEAETAVAALGDETTAVLPAVADRHQIVPPPLTGVAMAAAVIPPVTPTPPTPPYMQAPLAPPPPLPPQGEPRRKGRGGLISGIIIAILILAGAAAAATILLIDDSGSSTDTTAAQVTTTVAPATTLAPTTTLAPSTTVSESTTTSMPTETSAGPGKYVAATAAVAALLAKDDVRIPVLAKEINNTAPNVPQAVHDELVTMLADLNAEVTEMSGLAAPPAFAESDGFLKAAAGFMAQRIRATFLGIEEMYKTGKISSATKYFKEGQIARDDFREAFQQFQATRPKL